MFWLLLACITLLALSPKPPAQASLGWDKLNHAVAFLALGLMARWAWPRATWLRWGLALLGYGVLLEFLQGLTPNRQAEALDVLADAAGLAVALLLVLAAEFGIKALRTRRPARRASPPVPPR